MKKIIIPIDFSENAFNALKFAVELFRNEEAVFYLLHAYADEVYNSQHLETQEKLKEIRDNIHAKSDEELQKITSRISDPSSNSRHEFRAVSAFGLLIDEVNDLVDRENADLVITATRGKTNDRKITFGSNTLQIIKYVKCPVLSIPENHQYKDPEKILLPTNYMLPYQHRELRLVGDLARSFSSSIDVLYASRFPLETYRQKENKQTLREHFNDLDIKFHQEEKLEKTEAINKTIDEKEIDLLILVNSRHSYLENLLYRSTIDEIGLSPKIPFLVLQNFNRA